MNTPWKITVHPRTWTTKLLLTGPQGDDLMKASLPTPQSHPRALLTLLEGLALWSGVPLDAAICVGDASGPLPDAASFGSPYPTEGSALVRVELVNDDLLAPRRLTGVGDFSRIRQIHARRS